MKKKIQYLLILIILLIGLFCMMNKTNADEIIGMMKVYKIKINLINVDTDEYTIELIDGISNRIFESQEGNEKGEHNFAIATDLDESHLSYYGIKIKFKNGDVKNYDSINIDKLINVDDNELDSSYNYEYNVLVKLLPRSVIVGIVVILVIAALVGLIIILKKHKKRII